jgi:hypothetical protein
VCSRERYGRVVVLRLATLSLAQGLDLWTFQLMVGRHGIAAEANPLVADLFMGSGIAPLIAGKIALVIAVGALAVAGAIAVRSSLDRVRDSRIWAAVRGVPVALAITAGLIGGITNTAVILS